eukprot:gene6447-7110_t
MLGKEIPTRKGTIIRIENKPSQVYFDMEVVDIFPTHFAIKFQNYYTASILITQLIGQSFRPLMKSIPLMKDPYIEHDAQCSFVISSTEFTQPLKRDQAIRIFLFQPSMLWNKYELRQVQVFEILDGSSSRSSSSLASSSRTGPAESSSPTFMQTIASDWQVLLSQSSIQSNWRHLPVYVPPGESSKRTTRKKGKVRRQSVDRDAST